MAELRLTETMQSKPFRNERKISKHVELRLALIWVLLCSVSLAQGQDDIVRVDTNLVAVPVNVLTRDGRFVTNLGTNDFKVFEDGIEQEIEAFETVEQPFTVMILLDVSGSMTPYLSELTRAGNSLVRQLRPDDKVAVGTFADSLFVRLKSTKVSDLKKPIKVEQRLGESYTRIYDAVQDGLKLMKKIRGRKAIILFSDGEGEGTFASAKSNVRDAEENEALIYTIQFENYFKVPPTNANKQRFYESIAEANKYMGDLASVTGGRPYRIKEITDLEKTFRSITEELRQQYNIGYYPKTEGKKGERRQIKVKVLQPDLAVRARNSYVIGENK